MSETKKVVLITGANKGLGLETARQLGRLGYVVLVGARSREKAEGAAAALKVEGMDARAVVLDVVKEADVRAAAEMVEREFGVLDALVNNAGVNLEDMSGKGKPSETSMETVRTTFETNFFAVLALTQAMLPLLRKSRAGRVVNLSSILASLTLHSKPGGLGTSMLAYDVSKTALNGLTVHLANELRDTKIKVNAAHPGWVKTDMGGAGATMELPEGAKTVVDLVMAGEDGPTGGYFHLGKTLPW